MISSANSESFTSTFTIWIFLISFWFLIAPAWTSRTLVNRYGESGQPCLVPDFSGVALSFSPFSLKLTVACYILSSLCLRMFLLSQFSQRRLSWRDVVFCQGTFQHLMRWPCGGCLFVCTFIDRFSYAEPSLNLLYEAYLVMVDVF